MKKLLYAFLILFILFFTYHLAYEKGRIDTKIEVIEKVNELQKLPDEEKAKLLKTDWLEWND